MSPESARRRSWRGISPAASRSTAGALVGAAVHVDGRHAAGRLDEERAARGQRDPGRQQRLDRLLRPAALQERLLEEGLRARVEPDRLRQPGTDGGQTGAQSPAGLGLVY
jgi:hypothetical protein